MPKKDIRYYINTINLKYQAATYHLLDKLSLLSRMKKREETYFLNLYHTHFKNGIVLNHSFSTEYITYRYFPTAESFSRHLHFDREGVAMCRSDLKPHYNPLIAAFLGLVCYNDFLKNQNEAAIQQFWVQANHLAKKGTAKNGLFLFYYDKGTWYAGITQALVSSLFMRAYILDKEGSWKQLARQTLLSLFEPVENGGVFKKTPEGLDWVEEYPLSVNHPFVLNGFIFALTNLYEYLILCENDVFLSNYLIRLNDTLFKTLHYFKRKKYFKYSRFHWVFQNIEYQGLMVCQFLHLYAVSKNEAFNDIAALLNKDVDWAAFFRFYDMPTPRYFQEISKS